MKYYFEEIFGYVVLKLKWTLMYVSSGYRTLLPLKMESFLTKYDIAFVCKLNLL